MRLFAQCFLLVSLVIAGMVGSVERGAAQTVEDAEREQPRNVILVVGTGMGSAHVAAAGAFLNGAPGSLTMESWPHSATFAPLVVAGAELEAAKATAALALASGVVLQPGAPDSAISTSGNTALQTYFQQVCKRTGLLTTTTVDSVTPTAFAGIRSSGKEAAETPAGRMAYLLQAARPDVLMGGAGPGFRGQEVARLGYKLVENRDQLLGLTGMEPLVFAPLGFGRLPFEAEGDDAFSNTPHLSEMTRVALQLLETNPYGFLLIVESDLIAPAAARNDLAYTLAEMAELERTVALLDEWVDANPDSLLVVTGGFEVGGLQLLESNEAGVFPRVAWSSTGVTIGDVSVYARGANADLIDGVDDWTGIHAALRAGRGNPLISCPPPPLPGGTPAATLNEYPALPPVEGTLDPTPYAGPTPYVGPPPADRPETEFAGQESSPAQLLPDENDSRADSSYRLPRRVWLYPLLLLGIIGLQAARMIGHRSRR
jgi:alkaline phosphatase